MECLLDTNVLIWFLENNSKLKPQVIEIIEEEQNSIYVSTASFWEMAIKLKLKKLKLSNSLKSIFEITSDKGIIILDLNKYHILQFGKIEFIDNHNDPFDRIIISTAVKENFAVISSDQKFKEYNSIIKLIET